MRATRDANVGHCWIAHERKGPDPAGSQPLFDDGR
jgi:hypothetical protein